MSLSNVLLVSASLDVSWGFPEMHVPPNHPFVDGFFVINNPCWGYPHLWKASFNPSSPSRQWLENPRSP